MSQNQPVEYKIVFVGESGVGKTSIINRYYFGSFNENNEATIGTGYVKVNVKLENKQVTLNLWDTAGQEKYANLVPIYVRDSNLIVLCFDLTNPQSLSGVQSYYQKLREHIPDEVPVIICGNKTDLCNSQNDGRDVHAWAMNSNMHSFSVSAKTGQGIDDMFHDVAELALQKANVVNQVNTKLRIQREKEENPSSCGC